MPLITDEYFRSEDWSPAFYRAQARLGCIAVAGTEDSGYVLLPQLQYAYALLDWENLTVDKGVRRVLDLGKDSPSPRLEISENPALVLAELERLWGDQSWLYPPYTELIAKLASEEERKRAPDFRILGIELKVPGQDRPIAGELGYAIGRSYTSLSGFFRRENRAWNNYGKLQLVLLARRLEEAGFAFWNLGHPYMEYKLRLGARIWDRREFLQRWDAATAEPRPDLVRAESAD